MKLVPNTVITAGNHLVSIGRETHFVAILSPFTHKFVEQKRAKTNKRLRKVKRSDLKTWLNCDNDFCFERMSTEQTIKLIRILKGLE